MKFKFGLVPRLILAIILGIILGSFMPLGLVRVFKTFSTFFGSFLSFFIPFMIIGFVVAGIARLTEGAGKLLAFTAIVSYVSTIIAGLFSYTVGSTLYPNFVSPELVGKLQDAINSGSLSVAPYFTIPLKPALDVTAAIVFAFMMGITISYLRSQKKGNIHLKYLMNLKLLLLKC